MGGVYFFGIPLYEDAEAAESRREDREDRIEIRQDGKTDRTTIRQTEKTERTALKTAPDATVPGAEIAESLGINEAVSGVLDFFGLGPDENGEIDITALAISAAAVGVGVVALQKYGRTKPRR